MEVISQKCPRLKKHSGRESQNRTLSSHKTGMRKQLRRLKHQGLPQKQRATAKDRVIKSAVEEYMKHTAQDHLEQNLRYMLGSRTATKNDVVSKVLNHHRGRKARDRQMKKKKRAQEKSVFSDADFKRFEKEYFAGK
ncbi:active regulator of SIRT1 isoform X2 [Pseudophryne corroboree]|uniref:active regulator of SIRT1 isoform X2 n=1 Tax=Pseudophryne corroboree TaxID=495146 RepID=UPI0030815543